ncbi:MAG: carboxypeptidase regulatory-like domain-containing protein, partial [Thermoprotei archaeon]|nr:carboxypeptidase regulatory-like domain-containing protein [Thermoprotei archaeon]
KGYAENRYGNYMPCSSTIELIPPERILTVYAFRGPSGQPLSGVLITVRRNDEVVAGDVTDENGKATFKLIVGRYEVHLPSSLNGRPFSFFLLQGDILNIGDPSVKVELSSNIELKAYYKALTEVSHLRYESGRIMGRLLDEDGMPLMHGIKLSGYGEVNVRGKVELYYYDGSWHYIGSAYASPSGEFARDVQLSSSASLIRAEYTAPLDPLDGDPGDGLYYAPSSARAKLRRYLLYVSSVPQGMFIAHDGMATRTPFTIVSFQPFSVELRALDRVEIGGIKYFFSHWRFRSSSSVKGVLSIFVDDSTNGSMALAVYEREKRVAIDECAYAMPNAPLTLRLNVTELSEGLLRPGEVATFDIESPVDCFKLFNGSSFVNELKVRISNEGLILLPSGDMEYGILCPYANALREWASIRDRPIYLLLNITGGHGSLIVNLTVLMGDIEVEEYAYDYESDHVDVYARLIWHHELGLSKPLTESRSPLDRSEWFIGRVWFLCPTIANCSLEEAMLSASPINSTSWVRVRLYYDSLRAFLLSSPSYPAEAKFSLCLTTSQGPLAPVNVIGLEYGKRGIIMRNMLVVDEFLISPYLKIRFHAQGDYGLSVEYGAKSLVFINGSLMALIRDVDDGLLDGFLVYENRDITSLPIGLKVSLIPGVPSEARKRLILLVPWWDLEISWSDNPK